MEDTRKCREKSGIHFGSLLDRPLENTSYFREVIKVIAFHAPNKNKETSLVKISHAYNAILLCSALFQEFSLNAAGQNEVLLMQFGMVFNIDSG